MIKVCFFFKLNQIQLHLYSDTVTKEVTAEEEAAIDWNAALNE